MQAVGSPEASPGGSWETIPAGGKGRRSSAGGPRRTPPPQPPAAEHGAPGHAQRAAAAAAAADPAALKPAALPGHAAAAGAHQHKLAAPLQHQPHDSLASGHQPRQHVRAVPVSAAPTAHAKVSLPYECLSPHLQPACVNIITNSFILHPSLQSGIASVSSASSSLFCWLLGSGTG